MVCIQTRGGLGQLGWGLEDVTSSRVSWRALCDASVVGNDCGRNKGDSSYYYECTMIYERAQNIL